MKFSYKARNKKGELQAGFVEAGSLDSAANILGSHDLYVLSLESAEGKGFADYLFSYFKRVKRRDMVIFTRQFAVLLDAHLPINTALKNLYEQTSSAALRQAIVQMVEDVDAGLSLSQAMERQGEIFPQYYIEMIRTAEVTGNLSEVSGFLADYTEKEAVLTNSVISALIYPVILVSLMLIVAGIMLIYVFPQIKPLFTESGVELPLLTKLLLGTGDVLGTWWYVALGVIAALAVLFFEYIRTPEGRSLLDDAKVKLPLMSKVYLPIVMSRLSNAAALLIHGGIPVAQAVEVMGHMIGNTLYRDILHNVAESVRQGELLSQGLAKYPDYFPALVPQMVSVGETTGRIEQVFARLATFYGREADQLIGRLVELVQPVLLITIGVGVGLLFAAVLLPLFRITQSIHP